VKTLRSFNPRFDTMLSSVSAQLAATPRWFECSGSGQTKTTKDHIPVERLRE
jgi:hypothetical protein